MGTISLQIPTVGQPDTTEDPKVANNFTTLQTVINGNIDTNNLNAAAAIKDTQIASPNNSVRRLLLQSSGMATAFLAGLDVLMTQAGSASSTTSGALSSNTVPCWAGDAGYSGQPVDLAVAGKTAKGRVKANFLSASSSGATLTVGLYLITGVSGNTSQIAYSFGSAIAGTTAGVAISGNGFSAVESPEFTLPTITAAYALGVNVGGTFSGNVAITAQLLGYNN